MKTKLRAHDQSNIKLHNMSMVLQIIKNGKDISRSKLSRILKMSPSSATRIVGDLISNNLVIETETMSNGLGRKATQIILNVKYAYFIGFELTDKLIRACLLDFGGNVVAKGELPSGSVLASIPELFNRMHTLIRDLCNDFKISEHAVQGIGIGLVGTVDPSTGESIFSDLLNWEHIPLKEMMEQEFDLPVSVDNDIKCAIKGEIAQPSRAHLQDVSLVSFGRGVASATIYQGCLIRGVTNSAGEIGHTVLDYTDDKICYCGRRGCASSYLAEERIVELAKQTKPSIQNLEEIQAAYEKNELWAILTLDKISTYIAILIGNLVCFQNPDNIILRGILFEKLTSLRAMCLKKFEFHVFFPLRKSTTFLEDILKQNAVCVGASINALETFTDKKLIQLVVAIEET